MRYLITKTGDSIYVINGKITGWDKQFSDYVTGEWNTRQDLVDGNLLITEDGAIPKTLFASPEGDDVGYRLNFNNGVLDSFAMTTDANTPTYNGQTDQSYNITLDALSQEFMEEGPMINQIVLTTPAIQTVDGEGVKMTSSLSMDQAFAQESQLYAAFEAVTGNPLNKLYVETEKGGTVVMFRGHGLQLEGDDLSIQLVVAADKTYSQSIGLQQTFVNAIKSITNQQASSILLESVEEVV